MGDIINFPLDRIPRRLKCRWCDWTCPLYENTKEQAAYDCFGDKAVGWQGLDMHLEDQHHDEHAEMLARIVDRDGGDAVWGDVLGLDP